MPSPFVRTYQETYVGGAAASIEPVFRAPVTGTFTGSIIPSATPTAATSGNFRTIRYMNLGQAGVGTTVMGSLAQWTGSAAVPLTGKMETAVTPTTTGTPPANSVNEGDIITLDVLLTGTMTLPPGIVIGRFVATN